MPGSDKPGLRFLWMASSHEREKWISLKATVELAMPSTVNSASRLYLILNEGSAFSGDTATLKAWALLLHIKEPYDVGLSIDVSERLLWLNQELERLKRQLRSTGLHEQRQDSVLKHIEQALSPVYLATDWNKVKQFLSADTVTSLQQWAKTLPETTNPIEQGDMEAILAQAEEIKGLLDSSALSEELKFLVSQHVKSIRRAIARYPIAGCRALKEGAYAAFGELTDIEEVLKENCNTPEISKLINVWDKLNQLANRATVEEKSIKRSRNPWIYFCPGSS
jgi:hypothetical protein